MTTEDQGTLNNSEGGVSSSPVMSSSGDLISTVEFRPVSASSEGAGDTKTTETDTSGKDAKTDDTKASTDNADDKGTKTDDTKTDDDDRFDKHPRFQELNTRTKKAERRVSELENEIQQLKSSKKATPEELPYKDISKMSKDELLEWQTEDPHGYHENLLKQAEFNLSQKIETNASEQSVESAISKTYENYAKENPDFDEMWDSGEIKDFMDKNPGHNAISAHMALTAEKKSKDFDQKLKDEVEKATKETEKRVMDNIRTKNERQVLGDGPSSTSKKSGDETSVELSDTKKFGGLTSVLARRSAERMKARMGG